jgi:hypothetical protein
MKTLLLIFSLIFISCDVENKLDNTLQKFVGKDSSELIEAWGHPNTIEELPNGNDSYYYLRIDDQTSPTPEYFNDQGREIANSCRVWFEINKDLIIIKFSYSGTYCWET